MHCVQLKSGYELAGLDSLMSAAVPFFNVKKLARTKVVMWLF
jgi:hypothetical protein